MTNRDTVLTITEAAATLRISKSACYKAAAAGEIPTVRIGSRVLVPAAALSNLLGNGVKRPAVENSLKKRPATLEKTTDDGDIMTAGIFATGAANKQTRVTLVVYKGRPRLDFREFFKQADGTFKRSGRGAGIGLSDCPQLVDAIVRAVVAHGDQTVAARVSTKLWDTLAVIDDSLKKTTSKK